MKQREISIMEARVVLGEDAFETVKAYAAVHELPKDENDERTIRYVVFHIPKTWYTNDQGKVLKPWFADVGEDDMIQRMNLLDGPSDMAQEVGLFWCQSYQVLEQNALYCQLCRPKEANFMLLEVSRKVALKELTPAKILLKFQGNSSTYLMLPVGYSQICYTKEIDSANTEDIDDAIGAEFKRRAEVHLTYYQERFEHNIDDDSTAGDYLDAQSDAQ